MGEVPLYGRGGAGGVAEAGQVELISSPGFTPHFFFFITLKPRVE